VIVVQAKLISAVDGREEILGTLIIANDGTGTPQRCHYDVRQGRRNEPDLARIYAKPTRRARVENYPRQALSPWCLIARALSALGHK
jgi:hypothetical protein